MNTMMNATPTHACAPCAAQLSEYSAIMIATMACEAAMPAEPMMSRGLRPILSKTKKLAVTATSCARFITPDM